MSTITRRETLAWVSAAIASPWVASAIEPAFAQADAGLWKEVDVAPIAIPGYGSDPICSSPACLGR